MTGDHKTKQQKGFTLVEMIVAVGIFAIVSVAIAELFIISNRAQRRSASSQKVQSEARSVLTQITDRFRSGTLDYTRYTTPISSPTTELHFIDENDVLVTVRQSDTNFSNTVCPDEQSTPCMEISEDGGLTFFPMSSQGFSYEDVKFFVDPATDPFESGGPDIQPRVTFSFGLQDNAGSDIATQGLTYFQTSVSSRKYLR